MPNHTVHNRHTSISTARGKRRTQPVGKEGAHDADANRDMRGGRCSIHNGPAWMQSLHGGMTRTQLRRISRARQHDRLLQQLHTVFGPDCVVQIVSNRVRIIHERATEWFDLP